MKMVRVAYIFRNPTHKKKVISHRVVVIVVEVIVVYISSSSSGKLICYNIIIKPIVHISIYLFIYLFTVHPQ